MATRKNPPKYLRLKKDLSHQEFDRVLKKPVGLCTILTSNISHYDSYSDMYIFNPVFGTENNGEWIEDLLVWRYKTKWITPTFRRDFFFRRNDQWFCEKIEFEVSDKIDFPSLPIFQLNLF